MNERTLAPLDQAAALRPAGLQSLLAAGRGGSDAILQLFDFDPLAAECDGVRLRGYLRHRSFSEEIAGGTQKDGSWKKIFPRTEAVKPCILLGAKRASEGTEGRR
jgi:hypothetical protein